MQAMVRSLQACTILSTLSASSSFPAFSPTLSCADVYHGRMQVQRLQRFATYGYLKQIVLKMIAADLADGKGSLEGEPSEALDMVTALRYRGQALDIKHHTPFCCPLQSVHEWHWALRSRAALIQYSGQDS